MTGDVLETFCNKLVTWSDIFSRVTEMCACARKPRFDFAVVDECQDPNVPQVRFLAALVDNT